MLKAYSFTRVNENGEEETNYITFDGQNCSWTHKTFTVVFEAFSSQAESARKLVRLGEAELSPIRTRNPYILSLSGNDFLTEAVKPIPEAERALPFLLIFSNRIWQMALDTPFISDFSLIDENGNRVEVKKSLTDLNATLHEIEL